RISLDEIRGLQKGNVRLVSSEGFATPFLTGTISAFRKKHPNIAIDLTIASAGTIEAELLAGRADIGLSFMAPPNPQIQFLRRVQDPLSLVVAPSHRLAGRGPMRLSELVNEGLAVPGE